MVSMFRSKHVVLIRRFRGKLRITHEWKGTMKIFETSLRTDLTEWLSEGFGRHSRTQQILIQVRCSIRYLIYIFRMSSCKNEKPVAVLMVRTYGNIFWEMFRFGRYLSWSSRSLLDFGWVLLVLRIIYSLWLNNWILCIANVDRW